MTSAIDRAASQSSPQADFRLELGFFLCPKWIWHFGQRCQRMSALPPKADIVEHGGHVRFVLTADIMHVQQVLQIVQARLPPVPATIRNSPQPLNFGTARRVGAVKSMRGPEGMLMVGWLP
jgi:hypothetical protein